MELLTHTFCHYQLHDTITLQIIYVWFIFKNFILAHSLTLKMEQYILRNISWLSLGYTALNFGTQPHYYCRIPYFITGILHMHHQIQIPVEHWVLFLSHQLLGSSIDLQVMVAGAWNCKLTSFVFAYICQTCCCSEQLD